MAASLHVSEAAAGQSMTVFSLVYAVATPLLAAATASVAPRRVLPAALIVFTLANAATALAPSLTVLLATRVLAALGAAGFTPAALGAATRLVDPQRRGRALAVVMAGLNGAIGLGVPLGTLLGELGGWRWALWLVVALGFVGLMVAGRAVRDLDGSPRTAMGHRLALLRRGRVLAVLAVTSLAVAGGIGAYTYIAATLIATTGATGTTLTVVLVVYGIGALGGVLAAGVVSDRVGAARTAGGALVLQVAALLCVPLVHSLTVLAVLAVAWGASLVAFTPPQQHRLVAAAPGSASVAVSLNSSAIYVGQGAGAGLGGLALAQGASPAALPWLAAVPAALAVLIHLGTVLVPRPSHPSVAGPSVKENAS